MADILPFRGVRYDPAAAHAALTDLVAPPYDVISPDEQADLYARHPQNVIRLILGRETDKYALAARLFQEWQQSGILTADDQPAVYAYHQTFSDPVTNQACPDRLGLICLLKLEEYGTGKVLPHEHTLSKARADRLELMRATHAQFESIYGLYSDADNSVQSFLLEYDDREQMLEQVDDLIGSSHCVERIDDPNAHQILAEMLRDKPIFIADGHHRYETALQYRREWRAAHPEISEDMPVAADYILITLTAFEDEGLLVLPTHRMVRNVAPEKIDRLLDSLASQFTIAESSLKDIEAALAVPNAPLAFGLLLPGDKSYRLTLKSSDNSVSLVPGPGSDALKGLAVTVLQRLILEKELGIDAAALAAGEHVAYTRDPVEAQARVQNGEFQAAFLLGRPTVDEMRAVSLAGDVMPQKSTFFFPKLLSGLIMRDLSLDDSEAN